VPPFDIDIEYPAEVDGAPQPSYVSWMRSCSLISATGCPAMSVPAGFTADGLPVGLQVVAAPGADATVLAFGHAYEQATGWADEIPGQA
jgi:amidase